MDRSQLMSTLSQPPPYHVGPIHLITYPLFHKILVSLSVPSFPWGCISLITPGTRVKHWNSMEHILDHEVFHPNHSLRSCSKENWLEITERPSKLGYNGYLESSVIISLLSAASHRYIRFISGYHTLVVNSIPQLWSYPASFLLLPKFIKVVSVLTQRMRVIQTFKYI